MDIKAKVDELVGQLKGDPKLLEQFKKDPIKALEGLTGIDLPDEQIKPLVAGIQAKLASADIKDALGGLGDKLGGLLK